MSEQDEVYGFLPHGMGARSYFPHSALYYVYHGDVREEKLRLLAREEPDLAVVAECVNAMGLFHDCAELTLWRRYCRPWAEDRGEAYRRAMPDIARKLREDEENPTVFLQLYFSLVLPVAAAIDAGRLDVARTLYRRSMDDLLRQNEPVS